MVSKPTHGICVSCQEETDTYQYHNADLSRIQLCKPCYDQYLAKEMVNYWQEHIQEEKRRTSSRQHA